MDKETKAKILAIHDEQEKGEDNYLEMSTDYSGRRLVVCYNPIRAKKDRKDRERLLNRLEKMTDANGEIDAKKTGQKPWAARSICFLIRVKRLRNSTRGRLRLSRLGTVLAATSPTLKKPESEVIANYRRFLLLSDSCPTLYEICISGLSSLFTGQSGSIAGSQS